MKHPELEPDFDPDESVERLIASAKSSRLWAEERLFAQQSDCPAPDEIRALDRGLVIDADRRRKLARHVVACPLCLERNLAAFNSGTETVPTVPTALPRSSAPVAAPIRSSSRARLAWFVAAAASLLLVANSLRFTAGEKPSARLGGVFATDSRGFEMRSGGETIANELLDRRVAVEIEAPGYVTLGRIGENGVEPLPVDVGSFSTRVEAGEELILPLDRAIPCAIGEVWLVMWTESAPAPERLGELQTALSKGYEKHGVEGRRIVPRPR